MLIKIIKTSTHLLFLKIEFLCIPAQTAKTSGTANGL